MNIRDILVQKVGKIIPDRLYIQVKYLKCFGKRCNFRNPQTFNEKLQWLKLYDHKPEYTVMVDKYKVREYISDKIGEQYLIPLLGVWNDPDEIDFNALPNQFVLKCNHNSGVGMCICKDKTKLDVEKVKKNLRRGINQDYYLTGREWPYKNVTRKIIAEKFMIDDSVSELRDYKFYCFNGTVKLLMIASNRFSKEQTCFDYFDREYKHVDLVWGNPNSKSYPDKPKTFDEMVKISEKLSAGVPHVRVDLYECNGKVYFGELTFFDGSGFEKFENEEWNYKLGKMIQLPKEVKK